MSRFWKIGKELLMTMVWVFAALIIGVAILSFVHNRFGGNILGNTAEWIGTHAEYQG